MKDDVRRTTKHCDYKKTHHGGENKMTVKELVNLFDGVDFRLYDNDTQERSKLNPIHELPDANVTSVTNIYDDHLLIGYEAEKPVMIMCHYCNVEHEKGKHNFKSCDECKSIFCEDCQKLDEVKMTYGIHAFKWIYECPFCKE